TTLFRSIAVAPVGEHELALVIGAPERVRLERARQRGPRRAWAPPPAPVHEPVAIQHRVDRADGRTVREVRHLLPQLLADLRRAPAGIVPFQPDDPRLQRCRYLIGLALRSTTAVRQAPHPAVLVTVVNLVAGLPRDPEL